MFFYIMMDLYHLWNFFLRVLMENNSPNLPIMSPDQAFMIKNTIEQGKAICGVYTL